VQPAADLTVFIVLNRCMGDTTAARGYQIHEFARLTGLTVRALQHYDHLGLLKPVRSRAGHRTYSDQDLQALVQILALKSVGVPLRQIAALRRSGGPGLARALHMQRAVLERRRPLLEKAITAIQNVELALEKGEEADPLTLRSLIEAVGPQEDPIPGLDDGAAEAMAPAVPRTPDRVELRRRWQQLLDDVAEVSHTDPAGPDAQVMAQRWIDLLQELAGSGAALDAQLVKSAGVLGAAARTHSNGTPAERAWEFVGRALAARGSDGGGAAVLSSGASPRIQES
jgi:DNA-binding transcriptional MerR regulator